MCGIIGFAQQPVPASGGWRDKDSQLKAFFEQMLYMDALRGPHATGVMRVDHKDTDKNAFVYKRALHAYDFLLQPAMEWLTKSMTDAALMVGHNRFATQGGVRADANAHPFQFGNISLVHNGHVTNGFSLSDDNTTLQVDSAYVARALSTTENAIDVLSKIRGAYALVWHDSRDKTLNIARNEERPLFWVHLGDDKNKMWNGMLFASEMEMLALACYRTRIPINGDFLYPTPNTLYKFKLDDLPKFVATKYEPAKEVGSSTPFPETASGRGTVTHIHDHGRTKLSGRDAKWKRRLEHATSLTFDKPVEFITNRYVPYKNQRNLGAVYGRTDGEKAFELEVANVTKEQYKLLSECNYNLWVRPLNVVTGHAGKRVIRAEFCVDLTKWASNRKDNLATVKPSKVYVAGPDGRYIPSEEFLELTEKGCSNCGAVLTLDDSDTILWGGELKDSPICGSCVDLLHPQRSWRSLQ